MAQINQFMQQQLFSSPLWGFDIPDSESLNSALIKDCEAVRQVDSGIAVSNQVGWHSQRNLFQLEGASFRKLCDDISVVVQHVIKSTLPSFDLEKQDIDGQGWINVNGKGGFNTPHDHLGFHWSGVYYVSVPDCSDERSGCIEFLDPRGSTGVRAPEVSMIFAPKFQIKPRAGMMLIFPSYLRHWVYPNQDEEERISVAFNCRIVNRPLGAA